MVPFQDTQAGGSDLMSKSGKRNKKAHREVGLLFRGLNRFNTRSNPQLLSTIGCSYFLVHPSSVTIEQKGETKVYFRVKKKERQGLNFLAVDGIDNRPNLPVAALRGMIA